MWAVGVGQRWGERGAGRALAVAAGAWRGRGAVGGPGGRRGFSDGDGRVESEGAGEGTGAGEGAGVGEGAGAGKGSGVGQGDWEGLGPGSVGLEGMPRRWAGFTMTWPVSRPGPLQGRKGYDLKSSTRRSGMGVARHELNAGPGREWTLNHGYEMEPAEFLPLRMREEKYKEVVAATREKLAGLKPGEWPEEDEILEELARSKGTGSVPGRSNEELWQLYTSGDLYRDGGRFVYLTMAEKKRLGHMMANQAERQRTRDPSEETWFGLKDAEDARREERIKAELRELEKQRDSAVLLSLVQSELAPFLGQLQTQWLDGHRKANRLRKEQDEKRRRDEMIQSGELPPDGGEKEGGDADMPKPDVWARYLEHVRATFERESDTVSIRSLEKRNEGKELVSRESAVLTSDDLRREMELLEKDLIEMELDEEELDGAGEEASWSKGKSEEEVMKEMAKRGSVAVKELMERASGVENVDHAFTPELRNDLFTQMRLWLEQNQVEIDRGWAEGMAEEDVESVEKAIRKHLGGDLKVEKRRDEVAEYERLVNTLETFRTEYVHKEWLMGQESAQFALKLWWMEEGEAQPRIIWRRLEASESEQEYIWNELKKLTNGTSDSVVERRKVKRAMRWMKRATIAVVKQIQGGSEGPEAPWVEISPVWKQVPSPKIQVTRPDLFGVDNAVDKASQLLKIWVGPESWSAENIYEQDQVDEIDSGIYVPPKIDEHFVAVASMVWPNMLTGKGSLMPQEWARECRLRGLKVPDGTRMVFCVEDPDVDVPKEAAPPPQRERKGKTTVEWYSYRVPVKPDDTTEFVWDTSVGWVERSKEKDLKLLYKAINAHFGEDESKWSVADGKEYGFAEGDELNNEEVEVEEDELEEAELEGIELDDGLWEADKWEREDKGDKVGPGKELVELEKGVPSEPRDVATFIKENRLLPLDTQLQVDLWSRTDVPVIYTPKVADLYNLSSLESTKVVDRLEELRADLLDGDEFYRSLFPVPPGFGYFGPPPSRNDYMGVDEALKAELHGSAGGSGIHSGLDSGELPDDPLIMKRSAAMMIANCPALLYLEKDDRALNLNQVKAWVRAHQRQREFLKGEFLTDRDALFNLVQGMKLQRGDSKVLNEHDWPQLTGRLLTHGLPGWALMEVSLYKRTSEFADEVTPEAVGRMLHTVHERGEVRLGKVRQSLFLESWTEKEEWDEDGYGWGGVMRWGSDLVSKRVRHLLYTVNALHPRLDFIGALKELLHAKDPRVEGASKFRTPHGRPYIWHDVAAWDHAEILDRIASLEDYLARLPANMVMGRVEMGERGRYSLSVPGLDLSLNTLALADPRNLLLRDPDDLVESVEAVLEVYTGPPTPEIIGSGRRIYCTACRVYLPPGQSLQVHAYNTHKILTDLPVSSTSAKLAEHAGEGEAEKDEIYEKDDRQGMAVVTGLMLGAEHDALGLKSMLWPLAPSEIIGYKDISKPQMAAEYAGIRWRESHRLLSVNGANMKAVKHSLDAVMEAAEFKLALTYSKFWFDCDSVRSDSNDMDMKPAGPGEWSEKFFDLTRDWPRNWQLLQLLANNVPEDWPLDHAMSMWMADKEDEDKRGIWGPDQDAIRKFLHRAMLPRDLAVETVEDDSDNKNPFHKIFTFESEITGLALFPDLADELDVSIKPAEREEFLGEFLVADSAKRNIKAYFDPRLLRPFVEGADQTRNDQFSGGYSPWPMARGTGARSFLQRNPDVLELDPHAVESIVAHLRKAVEAFFRSDEGRAYERRRRRRVIMRLELPEEGEVEGLMQQSREGKKGGKKDVKAWVWLEISRMWKELYEGVAQWDRVDLLQCGRGADGRLVARGDKTPTTFVYTYTSRVRKRAKSRGMMDDSKPGVIKKIMTFADFNKLETELLEDAAQSARLIFEDGEHTPRALSRRRAWWRGVGMDPVDAYVGFILTKLPMLLKLDGPESLDAWADSRENTLPMIVGEMIKAVDFAFLHLREEAIDVQKKARRFVNAVRRRYARYQNDVDLARLSPAEIHELFYSIMRKEREEEEAMKGGRRKPLMPDVKDDDEISDLKDVEGSKAMTKDVQAKAENFAQRTAASLLARARKERELERETDDLSPRFSHVGSLFLRDEAGNEGFDADGEGPIQTPFLKDELVVDDPLGKQEYEEDDES